MYTKSSVQSFAESWFCLVIRQHTISIFLFFRDHYGDTWLLRIDTSWMWKVEHWPLFSAINSNALRTSTKILTYPLQAAYHKRKPYSLWLHLTLHHHLQWYPNNTDPSQQPSHHSMLQYPWLLTWLTPIAELANMITYPWLKHDNITPKYPASRDWATNHHTHNQRLGEGNTVLSFSPANHLSIVIQQVGHLIAL